MSQEISGSPATVAAHSSTPEMRAIIERYLTEGSAEQLEKIITATRPVLTKLRQPLCRAEGNFQVSQLLKSIDTLTNQEQGVSMVIGVVGNTGSGKSSVINAILDEEMMVPTNCMRACTSVITELSYNHSLDPDERYRAEVEFITAQDWNKELVYLYNDLIDSKGEVSKDSTNSQTDAGVAWAKIKAVYPQHTKEMLAESNPDELAALFEVRSVLGTTKRIAESSSNQFYERVQTYVDSKEKAGTGDNAKRKKGEKKPMEFWPLIKVVKIFTKADALSTGVKIVDLPGVQDSNAARAAVADTYTKDCDVLWIIAPITRAVDDKTAQNLLGENFKLQMKYDGKYSNVTFICSKTDDISATEATRNLASEAMLEELKCEEARVASEISAAESTMGKANEDHRQLWEILENLDTKIKSWNSLLIRALDGEVVYPRDINAKKRKAVKGLARARKKSQLLDSMSSSENDEDEEVSIKEENPSTVIKQEPLTVEDIKLTLAKLGTEEEHGIADWAQLRRIRKRAKENLQALYRQAVDAQSNRKCLCIRARNEYSTMAIRKDFAHGIKEWDEEEAMGENGGVSNFERHIRDYAEVEKSLPVFCVSARAFQKMKGRLQEDEAISGFKSLDETGIPGLQTHAKRLTESDRIAHCRKYLHDFVYILNSSETWSKDQILRVEPSSKEKEACIAKLNHNIEKLSSTLNQVARESVENCRVVLDKHLFDKFGTAIEVAAQLAVYTVDGWSKKNSPSRLAFQTYKATCRREGKFSGKAGPRDFNEELVFPLKKSLANSWEAVFTTLIHQILQKLSETLKAPLHEFRKDFNISMQEMGLIGLQIDGTVFGRRGNSFETDVAQLLEKVTKGQRNANRDLTPSVASSMSGVYRACLEEYGIGSYARMQDIMRKYIEDNSSSMFQQATDAVKGKLMAVCTDMETTLRAKIGDIVREVSSDCQHAVMDRGLVHVSKSAQKDIAKILIETEVQFKSQQLFA